MLDRVVEKLRWEFVQHGRPEHFDQSKVFLLGNGDAPYAALARQEIADTVADPAEVESEIRYLAAVLMTK